MLGVVIEKECMTTELESGSSNKVLVLYIYGLSGDV